MAKCACGKREVCLETLDIVVNMADSTIVNRKELSGFSDNELASFQAEKERVATSNGVYLRRDEAATGNLKTGSPEELVGVRIISYYRV